MLPVANLYGSNDLIVPREPLEAAAQTLLPLESTMSIRIIGANHASFGMYDDSERGKILQQVDGPSDATSWFVQDLIVSSFLDVALRSGASRLPTKKQLDHHHHHRHRRHLVGRVLGKVSDFITKL
jgi:hypothetical protein